MHDEIPHQQIPHGHAAYDMGEKLCALAKEAQTMLKKLADENDTMKSATAGVLPDGTPVDDMLADLKDQRAENAKLRAIVRNARSVAFGAKSATAYGDIKTLIKILSEI